MCIRDSPEARLHVPGARVLRTGAARERRADARRAGRASCLVLPAFELGADGQLVAATKGGDRELDARREVPDFGVGVGEEAAEVGEERLRALLAVAQVRRKLVLADPLRATEDHMRALLMAPVVRRRGLPWVILDLLLGERAGQTLALLVGAELEIGVVPAALRLEPATESGLL